MAKKSEDKEHVKSERFEIRLIPELRREMEAYRKSHQGLPLTNIVTIAIEEFLKKHSK